MQLPLFEVHGVYGDAQPVPLDGATVRESGWSDSESEKQAPWPLASPMALTVTRYLAGPLI